VSEAFVAALWSVVRGAFPDDADASIGRNRLVVTWRRAARPEGDVGPARRVAIVLQDELVQALDKADDADLVPVVRAAQRSVLAQMTAYTDDPNAEVFTIVLDVLGLALLAAFTGELKTRSPSAAARDVTEPLGRDRSNAR